MAAPEIILQLVETFDRNIASYKKQEINEQQLRHQFIDPFFIGPGDIR